MTTPTATSLAPQPTPAARFETVSNYRPGQPLDAGHFAENVQAALDTAAANGETLAHFSTTTRPAGVLYAHLIFTRPA